MAVMFTHAAGLVHKSICPDNVLLLKPAQPSAVAHELSAFLVGFEAARLRDLSAYSDQLPEADAIGKLYSHPERVIPHENGHVVRFGMRHDMYSLGIVLLELGMWKPIEAIGGDLSKADQAEFNARKLRKRLIDVAEKHLAATAGPKYSDAVLCCLRDATEKGLDDERGMREKFYYRVLQQLKQIVV
ncbi:hypothetical protein BT96DRAFT_927484 [Gymnopus androsaceus JB14]|uniref:Protein kinase domain-containing protein n=1 Tax=Gymnopus androsaceus JB14 TaxID=1447944 RepID=A0A6A4GPZ5_9AGAR|nr:hypothetical protein BT96DRAFT_927484 [Gymnopus androsaceus JB14]